MKQLRWKIHIYFYTCSNYLNNDTHQLTAQLGKESSISRKDNYNTQLGGNKIVSSAQTDKSGLN